MVDEILLTNESLELSINGRNRRGLSVPPLMEDDDTLRVWNVQVGQNADKQEIIQQAPIQIMEDPQTISDTQEELWSPGVSSKAIFEVRFTLVNNQANDALVTMGVEIGGAGGALVAAEYFFLNMTLHGNSTDSEMGPYYIAGDDAVRGVSSAADVINIHWNIKRVR